MSTKTQVVWIFGPSGAGKGTVIDRLTSDNNEWHFVSERLGLNGKVIKSIESLKNDDRSSDKVKIEVLNLSNQAGVSILIKVQWDDIENRCVPKELKQEIPNAIHKIVMLYITPTETVRRLSNDTRPSRRVSDEEGARSHLRRMIGYVIDLQKEGFETAWLDSNNDKYALLSQEEVENLTREY